MYLRNCKELRHSPSVFKPQSAYFSITSVLDLNGTALAHGGTMRTSRICSRWVGLMARTIALALLISAVPKASDAANVTLAWDPSADATVTGYAVYYGTKSGNLPNGVNVGNQTSYQITGLTDGQPY